MHLMDHTSTTLGTKIKKKLSRKDMSSLSKGHFVTPSPHEDISHSFDSHCTAYEKKKNERTKTNNEGKTTQVVQESQNMYA